MPLDSTTLAAAVGSGAQNTSFAPSISALTRKILIVANYDETNKTSIVQNTVYQVLSANDAGNRFGFGFAAHRLVMKAFKGSQGVQTYVIPVDWATISSTSAGTITITATSTGAGTFSMYIAGEPVPVTIVKGSDETAVALAIKAAIDADTDLPVTCTVLAGVATITSKDENIQANEISITTNELLGQENPSDLAAVIVQPSGGGGVMDSTMATALAVLGAGDNTNAMHITDMCHGFGDDADVLDDISEYNGEGDQFAGAWSKTVHRPFRSFCGDVLADSAGLTAVLALGASRAELDRTNGQISVPGSPANPNEIAAQAIGVMARINQNRPAEHFVGQPLAGVLPGSSSDNWARDADDRDTAVKAGISPTLVVGGVVKMQNVLTFYHPSAVNPNSNGYRSQVSISKLQNIIHNLWLNFAQPKWQGNALVESVANVGSTVARVKAKDRDAVMGDLIQMAKLFADEAWTYNSSFTIGKLQDEPERVQLRAATTGFDILFPGILSGELGILDNIFQFDVSTAALQS